MCVSHYSVLTKLYVSMSYRSWVWDIQHQIMAWSWNLDYRSLKVIENDTIQKLGMVSFYIATMAVSLAVPTQYTNVTDDIARQCRLRLYVIWYFSTHTFASFIPGSLLQAVWPIFVPHHIHRCVSQSSRSRWGINTLSAYSWNVETFVIGNACTVTAPSRTLQSYNAGASVWFGSSIHCNSWDLAPERLSFPNSDRDGGYDWTSCAKNSLMSPSLFCKEMYNWPKSATLFSSTFTFLQSFELTLSFVENRGSEFFEIVPCMEWLRSTSTVFTYSWYFFVPVSSSVRIVFTTASFAQLRLSRVTNSGKSSRKGFPILHIVLDRLSTCRWKVFCAASPCSCCSKLAGFSGSSSWRYPSSYCLEVWQARVQRSSIVWRQLDFQWVLLHHRMLSPLYSPAHALGLLGSQSICVTTLRLSSDSEFQTHLWSLVAAPSCL